MKRKGISIIIMVTVAMLIVALTSCAGNYGNFGEARSKFEHAINDNLSIAGIGDSLIDNSDRGFRGEVYITLGHDGKVAFPGDSENPYERLDKQLALENANIKVVQTYVYLIDFYDRDLTDSALQEMKEYFEAMRARGVKMLLRYAYEYTSAMTVGPTTKRIVRHCAQLKEWIASNNELFMDTVYSVQLGLVGLWGEGHGNINGHDVKKVISALCDAIPQSLNIMVRTPEFYRKAASKDKSRLTLHDDFLVGIEHKWGIDVKFKSSEYKQIINMTKRTICDGELPWGRDKSVDNIDLMLLVKQVRDYGLTTLSLTHNYMEDGNYAEYELYKARTTYMTRNELIAAGLPYNPQMLVDNKISYFDYLNYHLGYQIALSNYSNTSDGLSFMVNNYGLACPIGYEMRVFADGIVVDTIAATDMQLYQFGQYIFEAKGDYRGKKITMQMVSTRDGSIMNIANNLSQISGQYQLG